MYQIMEWRALTAIGRVIVVKSLLWPLLTNLFSPSSTPNKYIFNKINNMVYEFVWQVQPKIKGKYFLKIMTMEVLKMVDVFAYVKKLKILCLHRQCTLVNNMFKKIIWLILIKSELTCILL